MIIEGLKELDPELQDRVDKNGVEYVIKDLKNLMDAGVDSLPAAYPKALELLEKYEPEEEEKVSVSKKQLETLINALKDKIEEE